MNSFNEISDSDFVKLLESKLKSANWSVGEIVEVERRGMNFLNSNPELLNAILQKRAEFISGLSEAIEPYRKQFETLSNSVNVFKDLQLDKIVKLNPRISLMTSSTPKNDKSDMIQEIANTLVSSLAALKGIESLNKRDWFQWTSWIFSLIAAVATVVALIIY